MPTIHPTALVEDGARLGEGVSVGPFCTVGAQVTLGDHVRLISHVVVTGRTSVGAECQVYPFAMLGGSAQDTKHRGGDTRLVIGENNVIREQVTMHSGSSGSTGLTSVGNNGFYMVASHVAHDCTVGDGVIMSNNAVVGGHVTLGDHAILGGGSAVHQFARVGAYAMIGGLAGSEYDVIPYGLVVGNRGGLRGLNLIGLQRSGVARRQIHEVRKAYRKLFSDEYPGTLDEKLEEVLSEYTDNPALLLIADFVRSRGKRPILAPLKNRGI